jgi:predicted RNA-binding Zn-ribbon protein involved in translation (DUF1610 family)
MNGKIKVAIMSVVMLLAIGLLIGSEMLAIYVCKTQLGGTLVIIGGVIIFSLAIGYIVVQCAKLGAFECPSCGKKFRPTVRAFVFGPHMFMSRVLSCPHCGKTGWCKHKLNAEPDPTPLKAMQPPPPSHP